MSNPILALTQEHVDCDAHFSEAERAAQRGDLVLASQYFEEGERYLCAHFVREEDKLFPAFEAVTGTTHGPTMVMREEHSVMRDLLENCRSQLDVGDGHGFLAELDTLFNVLQQHNVKEENVLYPMCRQRIPDLQTLLYGEQQSVC